MRRNKTRFYSIDTHNCRACWRCIDACSQGVIGKIDLFFHRHIVIRNPNACIGCMQCVETCPHGVFNAE